MVSSPLRHIEGQALTDIYLCRPAILRSPSRRAQQHGPAQTSTDDLRLQDEGLRQSRRVSRRPPFPFPSNPFPNRCPFQVLQPHPQNPRPCLPLHNNNNRPLPPNPNNRRQSHLHRKAFHLPHPPLPLPHPAPRIRRQPRPGPRPPLEARLPPARGLDPLPRARHPTRRAARVLLPRTHAQRQQRGQRGARARGAEEDGAVCEPVGAVSRGGRCWAWWWWWWEGGQE